MKNRDWTASTHKTSILLFLCAVLAACYQVSWKKQHSADTENGRAYSVTSANDHSGNVIVGGASSVQIEENDLGEEKIHFQPLVLKYDKQGNLLWQFSFDNQRRRNPDQYHYYTGGAEIQHLVVDTNNNIFAAGMVPGTLYSSNPQDYDVALFKISANGELVWQRIIERPTQDSILALGLNEETHRILLALGHNEFNQTSSVEALALSTLNGETLWSQEHADEFNDSFLFSFIETSLAETHQAAASKNRIALSSSRNRVWVYDDMGQLLFDLPNSASEDGLSKYEPSSPSNQQNNATPGPDTGIACSGDGGTANAVVGLAFYEQDLYVAETHSYFFCASSWSLMALKRVDADGALVWQTTLPDPLGLETSEQYNEYQAGNTNYFPAFSTRAYITGAEVITNNNAVYVAARSTSFYYTTQLINPTLTADSVIYSLNHSGETHWHHLISARPKISESSDLFQPIHIESTWNTASALSTSAQGHLIVALNTQTVEGYPAYIYDLASTQLSSFGSRLIELDANTGEADYFATESGYFARTVLALPDNSVVKVGDSFEHKPIWWWMHPEGTPNEASVIHLSRYTQ